MQQFHMKVTQHKCFDLADLGLIAKTTLKKYNFSLI